MKNKFLEVGDVFELKKGMQVYAMFPAGQIYENRKVGTKQGDELDSHDVTVGEKLKDKYPTDNLCGDYVVVRTAHEGGQTGGGMNGHDDWPDGWRIRALRLKNGKWDEKGTAVSFYQSGCFTAMNESVPVKRKMKMVFV